MPLKDPVARLHGKGFVPCTPLKGWAWVTSSLPEHSEVTVTTALLPQATFI